MKRTMIYLAITVMAICGSLAAASASSASDNEVTIKGEVVDQPCFEGKNGARGEGHKTCALSCAKRGNQMAVVEDGTNALYSITGDYSANKNEKLIPFVAEMVEVKGTVTEKDGKKWLAISSIKKVEMK
jgi:type 1 fimbria pilin